MKLNYCLHTHTYRCGHAQGADKDYVESAINQKINHLGFSDHVFLFDISQVGIRGSYDELENYISSIKALKKEYADKIQIFLGLECEYAPRFVEYYKKLIKDFDFDYLICGQHVNFYNPDDDFFYSNPAHPEGGELYVEHLIEGIKSGLFTYIAHPDLYVMCHKEWDEKCENSARRILKVAEEYKMPLELNVNGMFFSYAAKNRLQYPDERFWKIAGEYDVDVVVGFDAHNPNHFERKCPAFDEWVKKYNLHLLKWSDIKRRMNKIKLQIKKDK